MNEKSEAKNIVSIAKGEIPQDTLKKGIENIGGISSIINKDDTVFIKVNLSIPEFFPVSFNFDTLEGLIDSCKKAGAQNVLVGGFADEYIKDTAFEQLLGFNHLIESLGVNFQVFQEDLNFKKTNEDLEENSINYPKEVMDADKLISLNQVSVNPLFQLNLSILNSYSLVSPTFQKIKRIEREGKDYLFLDQYKQDLISNILKIYAIRKPDLVINDLFYLLDGAGPYLFKNSSLRKKNLIILGRDALAVDIVTLSIFNIKSQKNALISEAALAKLGTPNIEEIQIVGEKLEESYTNITLPISKLEDLSLLNTTIKSGSYCSGCFQEAYRFLNYLKSYMVKDLKYVMNQSFLIGENPQEPPSKDNVILFGDCAINSTSTRDFRKITIKKKELIDPSIIISSNKAKKQKPVKYKEKENKQILEISGCPPNFYKSLCSFIQYYGKNDCPNGSFFLDLLKTYVELEKLKGAN